MEHLTNIAFLKVTYNDLEDLRFKDSSVAISRASFPMKNSDTGTFNLRLKGKTEGTLTVDMELHTKVVPAVKLSHILTESPQLRYTAFHLASPGPEEATDDSSPKVGSLFDLKSIRDIYSTNHYEGDAVTRFQVTLPATAKQGTLLHDVGGLRGVSIKCPPIGRSPIVNILVPTFCIEGVPEVRAIEYSDRIGKPVRVQVDLKNTDWQPGNRVETNASLGPTKRPKRVSFICPKFRSETGRLVMVVINRDDDYILAMSAGTGSGLQHKKGGGGSGLIDASESEYLGYGDERMGKIDDHTISWEDSPMKPATN